MKKTTLKLISLFISKESTSQYERVLFLLKALLWYVVMIHAKRIRNELVFRQGTSMNALEGIQRDEHYIKNFVHW